MKLLIVKPKAGLSTKKVYESLDIDGLNKAGFIHKDVGEMVSVIESDEADKTKIEKNCRETRQYFGGAFYKTFAFNSGYQAKDA